MSTIALKPDETVATKDSRVVWWLQKAGWRFDLWKKEFSVFKDRRIYAEFLGPEYQQHNLSRLQHLESLGLDLAQKSVLELGAGIGDHSLFYLYRNCRVLAVEGRLKLAKRLSERLAIDVKIVDFDLEPEKLEKFGRFDLVHCYGLLYHLARPARFLSVVSRVGECLLLETAVTFGNEPTLNPCREMSSKPSQALHGEGCRPTRKWVFDELKLLYPYVYVTRTQPRHRDFPTDWTRSVPDGPPLRSVFVASHSPIHNSNLLTELPLQQARW
jgi:SAM-dependent methyltransferase